MNLLLILLLSWGLSMRNHQPLEFISELIFLPISGPQLAGKKVGDFILPFQKSIITDALTPSGEPKHNIYMGLARKISKSMIYSWILNYFLEEKKGISAVGMASTFAQSNIIASLVKDQILFNKHISEGDYKITRDLICNELKCNTLYKVFSKASSNLGMLNVSLLVADEVGAMQSRENLNSIQSGMAMAQSRPLILLASNPPELPTHWSVEYLKTLRKKKNWKFHDYSASLKLDPLSTQAKIQANPFYAYYQKTQSKIFKSVVDFIDEEASDARLSSENMLNYRRMQLGQRISTKAYEWVSSHDLQTADLDILKDDSLVPILGFDIALSRDFCASVLCLFNDETEDVYLYPFLHLANVNDRTPIQQRQFRNWAQSEYITLQDRPAIDKSLFVADIKEFLKKYNISPEAYVWDRNLATGFHEEFTSEPVLYKGTGFEIGHGIRWIEARAKEHKVHIIGGNPALKWMFDCAVCSPTSKGNVVLDRLSAKSESIDGCCAVVMAAKYFIEHRKQNFVGFSV